jgi:TolB protein
MRHTQFPALLALMGIPWWIPSSAHSGLPTGSPPQPILFERDGRDGACSGEIWIMKPDGSSQHRVFPSGTHACTPRWSPDRSQVVFAKQQGGLYIADSKSWTAHLVLRGPDLNPDWSPDSRHIVFEMRKPPPLGSEVYTVNADGSNLRLLAGGPGFDGSPRWSPDGRLILFVSKRKEEHTRACKPCAELYVIAPDRHGFARLTRKDVNAVSPAWSPHGRWIAWARGAGPHSPLVLWIMHANTSHAGSLGVTGVDPSWSPDGSFIIFSRDGALFRLRPDGSDERRLTRGHRVDTNPDW